MTSEALHTTARAAVALPQELWPSRDDQMAAIEILLASSIPTELRRALREREQMLAYNRSAS